MSHVATREGVLHHPHHSANILAGNLGQTGSRPRDQPDGHPIHRPLTLSGTGPSAPGPKGLPLHTSRRRSRFQSSEIQCKRSLPPNPHFHLRLLVSQIIWKLSLTVSSPPQDREEFMVAMAQPPHLGDEGNLEGCSPASVGGKLVLGHRSRRGGLPRPSQSPRPEGGASCAPTQGLLQPAPRKGRHQHPQDCLGLFLGGERFKGSELENPRGRGIFSPMQITLSPPPALTPVSSLPPARPRVSGDNPAPGISAR